MKIPIWIYQVHPDHRSFCACLYSSAWVLHVNQGPRSSHLVSRSQSLAGAASSVRTLIMRVPWLPALSFSALSQFTEYSQCSEGDVLCCEKLSSDVIRHVMMLPLWALHQHGVGEVHPDCLWGLCCLGNIWMRENGSVINRVSEKNHFFLYFFAVTVV